MLLLLSGLPGSGKSTLARVYTARYGGTRISSDLVRAELGLLGHYRPGDKEQVYAAMLERTRELLAGGNTAVVDSTFFLREIRAPFEAVAQALRVPVFRVEVRAGEDTIRRRLLTPRPDSEADFSVYEKIRDQYEPWTEPHLELWTDTDEPVESLAETLHHYTLQHHDH
jgi:predicted kinase